MTKQFLYISIAILTLFSCNEIESTNDQKSQEATPQVAEQTHEGAGVSFVNIKDGDHVKSPLVVDMGIQGMEVEAAGALNEGKGHHHLIIDGSFEPEGTMVPKDETHIHYGAGQTSDTVKLAPGKHTLTLQFANGLHQSYGEAWSRTISVVVDQ